MHDHTHPHATHEAHGGVFLPALVITLGFALIEMLGGLWAHSLALLGDAGHMTTDGVALGMAGVAALLARRPASIHHTFGFGRMEVIAALVNTLFMLAIVAGLSIEAVSRLLHPSAVHAGPVIVIGSLGLAANVLIYKVLEHGEQSLNTRAALLHVLSDMLGSVAALAAGIVIWLTGWMPIDPLLSLFIGILILISSIRLLHDAGHVLLEGVPAGLDLAEIGRSMAALAGVKSVHDLHIWSLSSSEVSLSAHIVIDEMRDWQEILGRLELHLSERYHIDHTTLQPECSVVARIPVAAIMRQK